MFVPQAFNCVSVITKSRFRCIYKSGIVKKENGRTEVECLVVTELLLHKVSFDTLPSVWYCASELFSVVPRWYLEMTAWGKSRGRALVSGTDLCCPALFPLWQPTSGLSRGLRAYCAPEGWPGQLWLPQRNAAGCVASTTGMCVTVLAAETAQVGDQHGRDPGRALFLARGWPAPCCILTWRRDIISFVSPEGADSIPEGSTLRTSSPPNALPPTPSPWGFGFNTGILRGHKHSVHRMGLLVLILML